MYIKTSGLVNLTSSSMLSGRNFLKVMSGFSGLGSKSLNDPTVGLSLSSSRQAFCRLAFHTSVA